MAYIYDKVIHTISTAQGDHGLDAAKLEGHTWQEIKNLVSEGLEIVVDSKSTSADLPATAASANTMGKLYMVALSGQTESGTYTEFVTIRSGSAEPYTYAWEKIGTTAADLSEYAKKSQATGGPSNNATGVSSETTVVTGDAGEHTATGTISMIYKKSAAQTGSAGGHTHSVSVNSHDHAANATVLTSAGASGTTTVLTGVKASGTKTALTGLGTATTVTVLTGVKASATQNVVTGINGGSGSFSASVSDGVLSFSHTHTAASPSGTTAAVTGVTSNGTANVVTGYAAPTSATFVTGVAANGTATVVTGITTTTTSVAGAKSAATITATAASAGGHTHSISLTDTTITDDFSCAIGKHSHSVTIPGHTHSLNDHTHTQK